MTPIIPAPSPAPVPDALGHNARAPRIRRLAVFVPLALATEVR